ncbi:acyltransferase [Maribacter sp. 6B07]|uniref:acyltransferase family protein n=1 Tax=Maribacter sp. 6B07 TaxID=2045442 RepID=UPI0015D4DAF9|nr:acyltransferase [Maribacter sp. 6B07]
MIQRNINADFIKTISIFGVVFINSVPIFGELKLLGFLSDAFRFAVPCFIMLWAYFFENSYCNKPKEQRLKYLTTRFIYLFRVFFIWSFIYFIITVEWQTVNLKSLVTTHFLGYGWSGQYFFIILFQLIFLYPLLRKVYAIKVLRYLTYIISILLYFNYEWYHATIPEQILKLGGRPFYFWLPYLLIGIGLARNDIKKISPWFALVPFLIGIEFFILESLHLRHLVYITLGVFVCSILFCISLLKNNRIQINQKTENLIQFIGSNTLTIFVSNPLIVIIIEKIIAVNTLNEIIVSAPSWMKICIAILTVITVFISTLAIAKLLHKSKLAKIFV